MGDFMLLIVMSGVATMLLSFASVMLIVPSETRERLLLPMGLVCAASAFPFAFGVVRGCWMVYSFLASRI